MLGFSKGGPLIALQMAGSNQLYIISSKGDIS